MEEKSLYSLILKIFNAQNGFIVLLFNTIAKNL